MSGDMLLRCTGKITRVDAKEGVSAGTQRPYRIPFVVVLVQDQGVAEVNVPEPMHARLTAGDSCDWLVEVSTQGRYLSVRFVADLAPVGLARTSAAAPKSA